MEASPACQRDPKGGEGLQEGRGECGDGVQAEHDGVLRAQPPTGLSLSLDLLSLSFSQSRLDWVIFDVLDNMVITPFHHLFKSVQFIFINSLISPPPRNTLSSIIPVLLNVSTAYMSMVFSQSI